MSFQANINNTRRRQQEDAVDLGPRRIMYREELIGNSVASVQAGGRVLLYLWWAEHSRATFAHFLHWDIRPVSGEYVLGKVLAIGYVFLSVKKPLTQFWWLPQHLCKTSWRARGWGLSSNKTHYFRQAVRAVEEEYRRGVTLLWNPLQPLPPILSKQLANNYPCCRNSMAWCLQSTG